MKTYTLDPYHIDHRDLQEIAKEIKAGKIFIYPSDSVYSLGCSLSNKAGVERIIKITGKKEKQSKLTLICQSIKEVSQFTLPFTNHVFKTMNRYLPGPYTFVLKADRTVRKYFDNSKSEIGIRIPSSDFLQELFKYLDEPILSTSLNKSGDEAHEYYIDPAEIEETFHNDIDIFVDGGPGNLEVTTVLDCTEDEIQILRQGAGEVN